MKPQQGTRNPSRQSPRLGLRTPLLRSLGAGGLLLSLLIPAALFAAVNIAPPPGRGILGCQAAIDGSTGNLVFHVGTAANINDANLTTRVDNFGVGGNQGISFVGIV